MKPIEYWHADHVYFRRLLDLLEKQVDVFHAGGQPDYEVMLDIIHYLRTFSDTLHHPREDAAFARLAARKPDCALPVARLAQEHRVIAHAGERLARGLEDTIAGSYIERTEIEALAATYLVYYRSHIAREETDILPLAARLLDPQDWLAVQQAAGPQSQALEARFMELRRKIARET